MSGPNIARTPTAGSSLDAELPALHSQLVVFAREIGSLYHAERARSRELEAALDGVRETYSPR